METGVEGTHGPDCEREAGELGLRGKRESVGTGLAGAGRGELGGEQGC